MNLTSLRSLLVEELQDIYDAESQIISALPKLASAAFHPELTAAFEDHLSETQGQLNRLLRVFEMLGIQPGGVECEAARGLIREADEAVASHGEASVKDAALIGAAQRVEHYEIAAYGTACALAKQLDLDEVASLLHDTLEEEAAADKKLTKLAAGGIFTSGINKEAQEAVRY